MSIPVWVLLAFAGWTQLSLILSVGLYRWSRVLTGRSAIREFRADVVQGPDWYQRAMRAHANCVENLPVYAAVVLVLAVTGMQAPLLDVLALVLIGARVVHTSVHILFQQTNKVASFRFALFFTQQICMIGMGVYVAAHA